jgi:gamma-glutamyltranspeptidase/glutathione hydrolase
VEGLGFPLTTRMQVFYLDQQHPNALAPRKRPRTTLTPSLALRAGKPFMALALWTGPAGSVTCASSM